MSINSANQFYYPLASSTWDENELNAIRKVIDDNMFTMGKQVAQFEKDFAQKFGSKYAVMSNSGSSANLLAIAALCYKKENPLKAGDEVIVPSLSWATTYYPVHQYGLKLVFVDIDLHTLNLDHSKLDEALSPRTKAIFVPNILGNPAALDYLTDFCKKHNLYLIEDNCESMGAQINGKQAGTYGIIGTFSTFFSHHIATMEGGVSVTDDEELYHLMLSLRSHGWTRHLPEKNTIVEKHANPFYESFRFILPGYNVRPVEMSGAIGIEQLKKLDGFLKNRRDNAAHFVNLFGDDPRFIIQKENQHSTWFGFSMLMTDKIKMPREAILEKLVQANIEIRPVVSGNFLHNDVINLLNHRVVGEHHNAEYVQNFGFFVGNHQFDIKDRISHLHETLKTVA